jgi:hypothetical protein
MDTEAKQVTEAMSKSLQEIRQIIIAAGHRYDFGKFGYDNAI